MSEKLMIRSLFSLDETIAREYLEGFEYPWEALKGIGDLIVRLGQSLPEDIYKERVIR